MIASSPLGNVATGGLGAPLECGMLGNSNPSFFAPLLYSLNLSAGVGPATFSRTTSATCYGYQESDVNGAVQSLLTIPAGVPRFSGARFLASNNTWSPVLADGTPIPESQLLGYLAEEQRTNYLLNSSSPATQTTGSLATGTYTLWVVGTGSAAVTAGTATITGGGTATASTPNTFTVTVAGTVTVTVTGSLALFQLENGYYPTSYIPTSGTTQTRTTDYLYYPWKYGANFFSMIATVTPVRDMPARVSVRVIATLNNASNNTDFSWLHYTSTAVSSRRVVNNSGVYQYTNYNTTDFSKALKVGGVWSDHGMSSYVGGVGSSNASNTGAGSMLGVKLDIGAWQAAQAYAFGGNIRNVKIWKSALSDANMLAMTV